MKFKDKNVNYIFNKFKTAGEQCFLIGGAVRDFLLNKQVNDYDFACSATPEKIKQIFKSDTIIDTGLKHGTVSIIINKKAYEITTFRIDAEYLDNRHPNNITFTNNLQLDLKRRDFTINSIAYNPEVGIIDTTNGISDLNNKLIKSNGNPTVKFNEDALRILRALRFSSTLGFNIDEKTKQAIFKTKHLLKNISAERIASELNKLIVGKFACTIIYEYIDVIGVFIPELLKTKNFEQNNPHHLYDVLKHTCVALEGANNNLIIRLAILFHDIGKPDSYTTDANGVGHFYGHSTISYNITNNILSRLKYDNKTKHKILELIKYHDLDLKADVKYVKKLILNHDMQFVKNLIKFQRADNHGQGGLHAERIQKFNKIDEIIKIIEKEKNVFSLKDLSINGNDLKLLGFSGKEIGLKLNQILELVATGMLANDKSIIIKFIKTNN